MGCALSRRRVLRPLPQRPLNRRRLALDHAQEELRRTLRRLAALLLVAQRSDPKAVALREPERAKG